jgi:hypothetical protein
VTGMTDAAPLAHHELGIGVRLRNSPTKGAVRAARGRRRARQPHASLTKRFEARLSGTIPALVESSAIALLVKTQSGSFLRRVR